MRNALRIAIGILLSGVTILVPLSAQTSKPTCNKCAATYVPAEELEAYLKRAEGVAVADQQVRALSVGKTNVDIAVVYRGKISAPVKQSVAEHDKVSEVYHIIDGTATLMTGPDIVDLIPRPADDRAVRLLNGPGGNGASIRNGVTYQLKAGDVVVIPAGTGHLFTRIDDHIRYLMIRLDPDKIAPLKDEAASKVDLQTGFKSR
jgi:mannose-6-phosphate isomerase-like protein (cupin superfamily)